MLGIRPRHIWEIAALACQAPASAEVSAAPMLPQSAWLVDAEPGRCTSMYADAGGDTIAIQSWAGEDASRIVIAPAGPLPRSASPSFPAVVTFAPDQTTLRHLAQVTTIKTGGGRALSLSGVGGDFLAALSNAATVTISNGRDVVAGLALPYARRAIEAHRSCLRTQLIAWGADPAQFADGGRPPVALIDRDMFVPIAVLLRMRFAGDALIARFKIAVSADGMVGDCVRIDGDPAGDVAGKACQAVVSRTLFSPARAPGGNAVKGIAAFAVVLFKR